MHAHPFMPLPGTPWKASPPGEVSDRAGEIQLPAAKGRPYGQWQKQQQVAAALAAHRGR